MMEKLIQEEDESKYIEKKNLLQQSSQKISPKRSIFKNLLADQVLESVLTVYKEQWRS